ncbi:hypothetical protein PROFUN_07772 [Planoprotostelium fungivorum]|uniref:Signal peptidase complex catalytic subunit SEC11 n=1 Tax=Planoprotostelium fungivorum TaxID=1890364 RepID=A0A2P6MX02_9EUKA|nr:hypothetical protein PROFUN_07772 [Planoprotostelium fungivorum]
MDFVEHSLGELRRMNFRQFAHQALNFAMIVCSALMIWKGLMLVTGSESPVVVVLSGSMEPAYWRGDLLLLTMTDEPFRVGDVVVFKLDHRPIPIVHRILTVHENGDLEVDMLTKGDANPVNDRGLYERGRMWIQKRHIIGRATAFLPQLGMVTIAMNDYPQLKYLLIAVVKAVCHRKINDSSTTLSRRKRHRWVQVFLRWRPHNTLCSESITIFVCATNIRDRKLTAHFKEIKWEVMLDDIVGGRSIDRLEEIRGQVFLGLLALRSNVHLHLTDPTLRSICQLFSSQKETNEGECPPLPTTSEFLLSVFQLSSIHIIRMDNAFFLLKECIQRTNQLMNAILAQDVRGMEDIDNWIEARVTNVETYTDGKIRKKERHTFIFDSLIGAIQIGIPPETIKTSMRNKEDVPQYYILPPQLFAEDVSFSEVEFPIFFNFFIKQAFKNPENKVSVIGRAEHLERVKIVFKESVLGPDAHQIFVDEEISPEKKKYGYNIHIKKEMDFLTVKNKNGTAAPIEDFANFIPFDEEGTAYLRRNVHGRGQIEVKIVSQYGLLRFFEEEKYVASLDTNYYCNLARDPTPQLADCHFEPPTFGVTFLGTSHGFDKNGNTTGFILWINGRGIVVDPPIQTTEYLHSQGINTTLVNRVILTHCHSDHDSGVIRKIIEGEKIELYTTKTIHDSYVRKMTAATGLPISEYYHFYPVTIGGQIPIAGALFEFDYSFHTIPTLRFKLNFSGRSIAYSADTLYDPKVFNELRDAKIITAEREMSLRQFLFDADLIIHESGVPPVHTSIAVLNELPNGLKRKMAIVHCHTIPDTVDKLLYSGERITVPVENLHIPPCGLEHSMNLLVTPFEEGYCLASKRMKLISEVFLFRKISPTTLYNLYTDARIVKVQAGNVLDQSREDLFFIVEKGCVEIVEKSTGRRTIVRPGEWYGENVLRTDRDVVRTTEAIARTEAVLLTLTGDAFKNIIRKDELQGSRIDYDVAKIARNREFVHQVLSSTYLFQDLNNQQAETICSMLEDEKRFPRDFVIFREGDRESSLYIIKEGSVRLEKKTEEGGAHMMMTLGVGQVFGEMSLLTDLPRTATVVANENLSLMELRKHSFRHLLNLYQNLRVKVAMLVEQRLKENNKLDAMLSPRTIARLRL